MGSLESMDIGKFNKPIQLYPIANVQKSEELLQSDYDVYIGDDILSHLKEITINLNYNKHSLGIYNTAYKQFFFPIYYKKFNTIHFDNLLTLFNNAKFSLLERVNIIGADIFEYADYYNLVNFFKEKEFYKFYFFPWYDIVKNSENLSQLASMDKSIFNIQLFPPITEIEFTRIIKSVESFKDMINYTIIVRNINEVEYFEKLIQANQIENYNIIPFFDGSNIEFFNTYVFPDFNEILTSKQELLDIHIKEYINPNYFGKLTILPDNKIYSDVNNKPLGSFESLNLNRILFKALTIDSGWRRIRKNTSPCNTCVANLLCPSLSNYETIINRNKICTR